MKQTINNKLNTSKGELTIKNTDSPHFWWLISVLGVIIIALVAYIMTEKICCADKIMEYISYASVILSITLSVFAILYTYTSNVQIQQQFEKINSAATSIISTSDKLSTTGSKLNDNLETILSRLDKIDNNQEMMRASIDGLNTQTSAITEITNIPTN